MCFIVDVTTILLDVTVAGVCLPFIVSNQRLPGWEYSVFIFLVLNLISFIIIFIGCVVIVLHEYIHLYRSNPQNLLFPCCSYACDARTQFVGRSSQNNFRYTAIFVTVKSAMQSMGAQSTSTADEYALAKKLALIVASDFVCWVRALETVTNFIAMCE